MNPARASRLPRAGSKIVSEDRPDEINRTVSASSCTPILDMEMDDLGRGRGCSDADAETVLEHEGDEKDLKLLAAAFAAHQRLRREGRACNYFGRTTMTRFFKILTGHPKMFDGTMLWMPDRDPYERLACSWAAMSVYGSLVGVCALGYGMPDTSAAGHNTMYHISSSIMLCASMLLIIPVCQLTVMTVFFMTVPAHLLREKLSR
jgi:hypothetical protein